ncbi:hypothetical protein SDC9_195105 [bioreactor metagenome]|uniref:Uncharacterized protein n=1 Tax=bioreactor metagenome TaxID=1076179 RepID=A0A645IJK0_9ZZZZ
MAVQLDGGNGAGMNDLMDFPPDNLQQNQNPGAFDGAAGRTGAGAAEHQKHQQHAGKLRPLVKIDAGKAGG